MLSYSAYCGPQAVQGWKCHWCLESNTTAGFVPTAIIVNTTTNIFVYVGYMNNTVYVVFRGTSPGSLEDWIEDLKFSPLNPYPKNPNVRVHGGFYDAYLSIKPQLRTAFVSILKKFNQKPDAILFTGHSLGAALITICALDYVEDGLVPSGVPYAVYNFGSPRVGNQNFGTYYDSVVGVGNTWRVINKADIVPHLPPELMSFFHVNRQVWYTTYSSYKICANPEDPNCADSVWIPNVLDHGTYLGYDIIPYCWL